MKTYKSGDEILPGVVYLRVYDARLGMHIVRIGDAGFSSDNVNTLYANSIEALESIAAELASLRARVPTEWRTGVPDLKSLHPNDQLIWEDSFGRVGTCLAKETAPHAWEVSSKYIVIPHAPEKKQLTVADLPDFDGRVKYRARFAPMEETNHHRDQWSVLAMVGQYSMSIANEATEALSVQAALDAIKEGKLDRWLGGAA